MSEGNIENIAKSDNNFALTFVNHHLLPDINLNGHCLIENISILKKVINLYISYTLNQQLRNLKTDFTLGNCLFRSARLTKNVDLDKYKYSCHRIGFISCSEFSLPDGSMGKACIIFGADMNSFVHIDNKGKNMFILGEGSTQGLHDTILTEAIKAIDPKNFTQPNKKFVLSLCCNGSNSFLFVNGAKIYQFKTKNSEIKDYALYLGSISKDFTIDNMKKQD